MAFFKRHFPVFILAAIALVLCARNYSPGTILSGWDTLHPEFNFALNIERVVFGVFRPEQGLGSVAGHSHMADLPRILILFFLDMFFHQDFLRYLSIFLHLIIGPIGMYFFLLYLLKNKTAAFLGGLLYLLNLGTLQQFVVPFEMFTTQYAFLPWLFLTATAYLHAKAKATTKLLYFSLATLLAIPMAYAATLWYLYFFVVCLYVGTISFLNTGLLKKSLMLIAITLLVNSFWLLPNIYFITTSAPLVSKAQSNALFSEEAFLRNKEFGNVKDIALLKSFLFDWSVYAGNNTFDDLLAPWNAHLQKPLVTQIGFFIALVSFLGLIFAITKRNHLLFPFLLPFLVCLFFLFNDNFPTTKVYNVAKDHIPLFKEALRFPHNKVFILFTFIFAVFFAYGQLFLSRFLSSRIQVVLFSLLLVYFMLPAVAGQLISPYMRIQMPRAYGELFAWFNQQDNGRIANLPIPTLFGWEYYNWHKNKQPSFQGAGFLWFGIKQPMLVRDFDRWNPSNEQYYREMSYAIYSQNPDLVALLLEKYHIRYLLLDTSIISPPSDTRSIFYGEIKELLKELQDSNVIKKSAQFGSHLFVYKTVSPAISSNAYSVYNPLSVAPQPFPFYQDVTFAKHGSYITKPDKKAALSKIPISLSSTLSIDITSFPQNRNKCGSAQKEAHGSIRVVNQSTFDAYVEYSAQVGALCNHFSYHNVSPDQAYLLIIKSKNIQGLPLRLCVANHFSKHCDIYTQLSSMKGKQDFVQDIFLLPPMKERTGFDIHVSGFGIKKTPSINQLKTIAVVPFSYPLPEDTKIEHIKQEVLVLPQSYDKGWKLYRSKKHELGIMNTIANIFPFLFGKEVKEHVLVNNWGNGWIISSQSMIHDSYFIILYVPHYLEYIGFILLGGTFAWSIIRILSQKGTQP